MAHSSPPGGCHTFCSAGVPVHVWRTPLPDDPVACLLQEQRRDSWSILACNPLAHQVFSVLLLWTSLGNLAGQTFWDASLLPSAGELKHLPQQPLPEPLTLIKITTSYIAGPSDAE